ncbi:hypothetical protein WR25_03484 [Diploscapter pachys]|uniref:Uncharacterized protein n=1 Tax=Diploscapter pachys TaxID=2018661 RepID=A0A2A2LLJ2_9BILA|nr:hypothetical protein WR25_03484 [Diploscapter pachys]
MSDPPKVGSFEDCRKVLESVLEKVIGEAAGAVEFKFDESLKTKLTGLQLQNLFILTRRIHIGLVELATDAVKLRTELKGAMHNFTFYDEVLTKVTELWNKLSELKERRKAILNSLKSSDFAFLNEKQDASVASLADGSASVQEIPSTNAEPTEPIPAAFLKPDPVELPKFKSTIVQKLLEQKKTHQPVAEQKSAKKSDENIGLRRKKSKVTEVSEIGKVAEVPEVAQLTQTLEELNKPKVTPETITIEDTPRDENASQSSAIPPFYQGPPKFNLDLSGMESLNEPNPFDHTKKLNLKSEAGKQLVEKMENNQQKEKKTEKPTDPEAIIKPFMQLKPRPVFRSNTFKDYK